MVDQYCKYVCGKCKKEYDTSHEAHTCEDNHTNPEDIAVIKVDCDRRYEHITGHPQAITTLLKGKRRAVYVLRYVEHDYIEDGSTTKTPYYMYHCDQWHPSGQYAGRLDEDMNGMLD